MQPPTLAQRSPRRDAGSPLPRFQEAAEPFGELERELAADVESSGRRIIAASKGFGRRSREAATARSHYMAALERLSELRPLIPLWQLERMALPRELKDPEVEIFGLPRTRLPFSPGDLLPSEQLGSELAARLSLDCYNGSARPLAMMLHRMVICGMEPGEVGEFYRHVLSKILAAGGPSSGSYYQDLVSGARFLAGRIAPVMAVRNASLFKMSPHKDICTKTGDALAEPNPDQRRSYIRDKKSPPKVAEIKIGSTLLSRIGVEYESDQVVDGLSQAWGLPMRERHLISAKLGREDLLSQLSFIISSGRTTYSHPDLPGMEFSEGDLESAIVLLCAAGIAEGPGDEPPDPLPLDMLLKMERIGGDGPHEAKAALRSALMVVGTMRRVEEIRSSDDSISPADACLRAAEDVREATNMVAQFRLERASPSPQPHLVSIRIRRMIRLSLDSPQTPAFALALTVIDEMRKESKPLKTLAPLDSLNEPPDHIPRPSKVPIIAPRAGPGEVEVVPLPSPETAYSPERDAAQEAAPAPEDREGAGHEEPMKELQKRKATILGMGPPRAAAPSPSEGEARFDSERPTLVLPALPQAIAEMIPAQKVALDSELEEVLPQNTDANSAAVRHLSRYLAHCLIHGFDESLVPVFLRGTYSSLVKDASPTTVRLLRSEIATDAPDASCAVSHKPFEHAGFLVRPRPIVNAITALVEGTDFSALGKRAELPSVDIPLDEIDQAEAGPEIQIDVEEEETTLERAIVRAAEERQEKPALVLPVPNLILDDRLEDALPPKTDKRAGYIRHVSRILTYYLVHGSTDENIHEQYRDAVRSLRGQPTVHHVPILYITGVPGKEGEVKELEGYEFSPATVIEAAIGLVDGCDLKNVMTPQEYALHILRTAAAETAGAPEAEAASTHQDQKEPLELPLSNSIMDDSLEAVLPPKTDRRSALIRHASRIIGYYLVNGFEDGQIHRQYQSAVASLRGERVDRSIPVKYITGKDTGEHVQIQGFAYDPEEAVRLATAIVDSSDTGQVFVPASPAPAPRQEGADLAELRAKLETLSADERGLVSAVMGNKADEAVLREFMNLNPGRRELLVQQYIDSRWNEGDWKRDVGRAADAAAALYPKLGLERAGAEQKLAAISEPAALSRMQRQLVASLFSIHPDAVDGRHIEGFAAWVSGDQARIGAFWESFFVDPQALQALAGKMAVPASGFSDDEIALIAWMHGKEAGALSPGDLADARKASECAAAMAGLKGFWMRTPLEERRRIWRSRDLLTAADAAEKLRFSPGSALGIAEAGMLSAMLGRPIAERGQLTQADVSRLSRAFIAHTISIPEVLHRLQNPGEQTGAEELAILSALIGRAVTSPGQITALDLQHAQASFDARSKARAQRKEKDDEKFYVAEMINLASMGHAVHPSSLLIAARRQAEFATLLEFAGLPADRALGRITTENGISRPKRRNGGYLNTNDDSYSSAVVELPDGRKIELDAVCDGMGGMDQGAAGPIPNGQIASNVARDVFEICAAAGWIRSPEDARKVVAMADLAVTMEQIYRKRSSLDQEAVGRGEPQDPATPFKQRNFMGTTMTIGLQDGRKFWGIHCGDSQWKVLRGQGALAEADEHSLEYHIRLTRGLSLDEFFRGMFEPSVRAQVLAQWQSSQEHAEGLARNDPSYVAVFERQVKETLDPIVAAEVYRSGSRVTAGLAQNMQYLHINNRDSGYGPIFLEKGDLIALVSDGVSVPICNHEYRIMLESAGGDMVSARELILSHAENRIGQGPHGTLCSCVKREGKSEDDKTVLLRSADGWFRDQEVQGKLREEPRAFASSPERLALLARCAQADVASVKEAMLSFIEAAESAPEEKRSDAYTVAIATIFDVAAQRPEREELLVYLSQRIGGWSGILISKLMKSPDFSPRKQAMLNVAARCVRPEELAPLAAAANPQISAAVSSALFKSSPPQPEDEEYPEPIFRSQRSESGRELLPNETRYLDSFLIDINESMIVQETAAKLRVLPRDLEVMVFNVYSGFDPAIAADPHSTVEGQNLICEVTMDLSAQDVKKILVSSYLIYRLRETEPGPAEAQKFIDLLWKSVKGMDDSTPYSFRFYNETLRLTKQYIPDDPRCFQ